MSDDEIREQPEVDLTFFDKQVTLAQRCHDRGIHFAYAHPQDIDRAMKEFDSAIRLRESIFGKFHNDTGLSYFRKASVLRESKDYTQALVVARREIRISHRLLGGSNSESPVVASDSEQWWLVERIQWIQEVLTSQQRDIPEQQVAKYSLGLLSAMEFERLGDRHFAARNYDLALNKYDRALGLEASARDHNPIEVADLQVKIGDCFTGMKDYDAALQEYDNAERTYLTALGPSFRVVGQVYQARGAIFLIQKKFDDALRSYAKAYAVFEQALGKEHELSMEALKDIRLVTVKEKEELRNVEKLRPESARVNDSPSIKGNRAHRSLNEYSSRRFSNSSFHS